MTQLMNLPASFELNLGSGRRCDLLFMHFQATERSVLLNEFWIFDSGYAESLHVPVSGVVFLQWRRV